MIELSGIVKRFGDQTVLKDIGLTVKEGRVTALIGPSGSGKSTLLRCINLLEIPQAGELRFEDIRLEFASGRKIPQDQILKVRRKTGMIFQNFQLFPHKSAIENVMEGLVTVARWPAERARVRALELLEKVGLAERADAWPANLSGGQQQRVAIARALAQSPQLILCDEPTSALDPELAAEVVEVLRQLAREGTTMLMATHDLRLASQLADHVVFLEAGEIVEAGPPEQIFGNPQRKRTARFVVTLAGANGNGEPPAPAAAPQPMELGPGPVTDGLNG